MRAAFSAEAWAEYRTLRDNDPKLSEKFDALIADCTRNPFQGIGKPEPLRGNLQGWWSRRITQEHRLVYRVTGAGEAQTLEIRQCRFHY